MQTHNSNLRPCVREHFTDKHGTAPVDITVSTPNHPAPTNLFARIDWRMVYDLGTLAIIALCGVAHAVSAYQALNNPSLFASVMPVFGFTACVAYGLICYASKKGSLLKLVFVAGALTSFWVQ